MRLDKRPISTAVKIGIAGVAAVTVLGACSSGSSNKASSTSTAGNQATTSTNASTPASAAAQSAGTSGTWTPPSPLPVKIALIGPPPLNESLWADVANDQGFFKDVGLTPKFAYFGHGTDIAKSVVAGSNDIGLDTTPSNIQLVGKGTPLVAFAGMTNQDWLVGVSDAAVKTCKDLKGVTIGDDGPNNARRLFLGQLLQSCGLTLNDTGHVAIGSTPTDIVKAAINGQVKAAVLHAPELAEIQDAAKVKTWHGISAPEVIAQGDYSMFSAMKNYLGTSNGLEVATRVTAAYILARSWIMDQSNWNAFATITAKAQGISQSAALTGIQLLQKIPFWEPGNGLTQSNIEGEINLLVQQGSVTAAQKPTYDQLVDLTIYPKALAMAQKIDSNVKG